MKLRALLGVSMKYMVWFGIKIIMFLIQRDIETGTNDLF